MAPALRRGHRAAVDRCQRYRMWRAWNAARAWSAALVPYFDCTWATILVASDGMVGPVTPNWASRMAVFAFVGRSRGACPRAPATRSGRRSEPRRSDRSGSRGSCQAAAGSAGRAGVRGRVPVGDARLVRRGRDDVADVHGPVVAEALADRARLAAVEERGGLAEVWIWWPYSWRITSASSASSTPPLPNRISSFG